MPQQSRQPYIPYQPSTLDELAAAENYNQEPNPLSPAASEPMEIPRPLRAKLIEALMAQETQMPALRPDVGPGAYEDQGQLQAPSKGRNFLGQALTGLISGMRGPEAGAEFKDRYYNSPFERAVAASGEKENARLRKLGVLSKLAELENQDMEGLTPKAVGGGIWIPDGRGGGRWEMPPAGPEALTPKGYSSSPMGIYSQDTGEVVAPLTPQPAETPEIRNFKFSQENPAFKDFLAKETAGSKDEYEKAVIEGWKGTRAEWKTLVAETYATGWTAMATPEGKTIWVHKSTGEVSQAPPGTRPQFTAAERTQLSDLDELIGRSDRLREIADKNRGSIGWVQGKASAVKRNVIGTSDEVNEMFRISDNMADVLLRARSGAQINEQEYKRLRTLVPNPRLAESKFFSDLELFQQELQRIRARRSGAAPLITPGGGSLPQDEAPPVNLLKEGIGTQFGNGQVWTLRNGKAVRVK